MPAHEANSDGELATTNAKQNVPEQAEHEAYLLRVWRSNNNAGWRASLQSVRTGERHMFADLDSLLAFLIRR